MTHQDPPQPTAERSQALIQHQLQQAMALISQTVERHGLSVAVLAQLMEHFAATAAQIPIPEDVACRSGCTYCCHTRVSTSIPEVLVIADSLRHSWTDEQLTCLSARVQQLCQQGQPQDQHWWHASQTACPFLSDTSGLCTIYPIRPFTCRSHHSLSREDCRCGYESRRADEIPCYPLLRRMIDLYSSAFILALRQHNLASYQVALVPALNLALNDPQIGQHWLAGDDPFRSAAIR